MDILTHFFQTLNTDDWLLALLWIIVSFLQGLCGMGSAMIAIPLMTLMMPVHAAILTCCVSGPFANILMVILHGRHANFQSLWKLVAFTIPGGILGVWIITQVSGTTLQLILATVLFIFLLWQYYGKISKGREHLGLCALSGTAAGLFGASIAIDGPAVAAYGLYAQWKPREFLGTLALFFLLRGFIAFGMQYSAGLYTPEIWHCVAIVVPSSYLGLLLSFPFAKKINPELFRTAVKAIIFLCALMSTIKVIF